MTTHRLFQVLAFSSLLAISLLRLYAFSFTDLVLTWDDKYYRQEALWEGPRISTDEAIKKAFLPNPNVIGGNRTVGYHSWLVLGYRLFSGEPIFRSWGAHIFEEVDTEAIWQKVNLFFFFLLGLVVYLNSYWATGRKSLSIGLTYIFISTPCVFGLNRWVMTESHTMLGMLLFPFIGAVLMTGKFKSLIFPFLLSWIFGMFSSLREHALPLLTAMIFVIPVTLFFFNRKSEALVFGFVMALFVEALMQTLPPVMRMAMSKMNHADYWAPFFPWLKQVILVHWGSAFSAFILFSSGTLLINLRRSIIGPLHVLLAAMILVFIAYVASNMLTNTLLIRNSIPPVVVLFSTILIGIRVLELKTDDQFKLFEKLLIPLIAVSWITNFYQLFIAYDGGKTFAHPAYGIADYNHPLHLRKLNGPDDMHILWDKPLRPE